MKLYDISRQVGDDYDIVDLTVSPVKENGTLCVKVLIEREGGSISIPIPADTFFGLLSDHISNVLQGNDR